MDIPDLKVAAVNDIMSIENAAYLLTYDSIYGKYDKAVFVHDKYLLAGDKKIMFYSESDPAKLRWKELNVDVAAPAR